MFPHIAQNPKAAWRCSNRHIFPWNYPHSACPKCGLHLFRLHAPAWLQHDKRFRSLWNELLENAEEYHRHTPRGDEADRLIFVDCGGDGQG